MSEVTGEDIPELLLRTSTEQLRRTDPARLSVFAVAVVAHSEAVRRGALDGPVVACAGHSLGEYVALTAAGALTLRAAATLVAAARPCHEGGRPDPWRHHGRPGRGPAGAGGAPGGRRAGGR
ncbi:hypothetical protein [Streptomyces taklimakanensis]|uniref:hypothetical protein n=1 Tax=Streptomyces taklimakanensis TaxID=2569853 RepID=UPI00308442D8